MRALLSGLLAPVLAGAMLMACGNGDDNNGAARGIDAGSDAEPPIPDGSFPPVNDGGKGPATDASDGGCNFATFVKGLIANDTTASALPSTDLGQSCKDNQDQAEFQSLFP
jgi:hypothetical protein